VVTTPATDPAGQPSPAAGVACPDCSSTNRADAWFCNRCARQLRDISLPAAEQTPAGRSASVATLTTPHGDIRRQEFRQAMRARNGGRRAPYNQSLAVPTVAFRGFMAVLLLAVLVFGLVILDEGVHRVFGL
jgi:hypothetical protein